MDNSFFNLIQKTNPNGHYPSNIGKKWDDEEETLLLEELQQNMDVEMIAQKHGRTIGSIISRRKNIVHKLYNNNISIEDIMNKTKLTDEQIKEIIRRKYGSMNDIILESEENYINISKIKKYINKIQNNINKIQDDINELNNDINELKKII